jgi:hypothetical protein
MYTAKGPVQVAVLTREHFMAHVPLAAFVNDGPGRGLGADALGADAADGEEEGSGLKPRARRFGQAAEATTGVLRSDELAQPAAPPPPRKPEQTRARIKAAVKSHILFNRLEPAQFDLLIDQMAEHTIAAGMIIIHEGEKGNHFYIVDQVGRTRGGGTDGRRADQARGRTAARLGSAGCDPPSLDSDGGPHGAAGLPSTHGHRGDSVALPLSRRSTGPRRSAHPPASRPSMPPPTALPKRAHLPSSSLPRAAMPPPLVSCATLPRRASATRSRLRSRPTAASSNHFKPATPSASSRCTPRAAAAAAALRA